MTIVSIDGEPIAQWLARHPVRAGDMVTLTATEHPRCGGTLRSLGDCVVCKQALPCRLHKAENFGKLYGVTAKQVADAFDQVAATFARISINNRIETKEITMKDLTRKEAQELLDAALRTVTPGTKILSLDLTPSGVYFEYQSKTRLLGHTSHEVQCRRVHRDMTIEHVVACSFTGNSRRYNYVVKGGPPVKAGTYLRVYSPVTERDEVVQVMEADPATGPQENLKEALRVGIGLVSVDEEGC